MTDPSHFTDPAWAAQITADEERDALAWVNRWLDGIISDPQEPDTAGRWARAVKARLARPVMPAPEALNETELSAMRDAIHPIHSEHGAMRAAYRALYAHMAKPKKLKPVFHCDGSNHVRHKSASNSVMADWHDLNQAITALCNDGYQVVTVRREMVPE